MLAALVIERGQVKMPGFYDDVVPLTDDERKQFAALAFDEQEFQKQIGVRATGGEEGLRRWSAAGPGRRATSTA